MTSKMTTYSRYEFLTRRGIRVTEEPKEYPHYTPGYYAVFFDDPINGIHWELARLPIIPSPREFWRSISRPQQNRINPPGLDALRSPACPTGYATTAVPAADVTTPRLAGQRIRRNRICRVTGKTRRYDCNTQQIVNSCSRIR